MSAKSYKNTLNNIIDIMNTTNYIPNIIDIGGGFNKSVDMYEISRIVTKFIEKYPTIKYIAEPGRFMVEDIMDLYVTVIGKSGNKIFINNSIYGDFNSITYDHKIPTFEIYESKIKKEVKSDILYEYNIYGGTCDSMDIICKSVQSPEINEGDILKFDNFGAYSISSRSEFNGIKVASLFIRY
jgi:ornithine decarboxylase